MATDQLLSFGKEAFSAYEASQQGHQGTDEGEVGVQASAGLNSADNNRRPQGGQSQIFDHQAAIQQASQATGEDPGLFSNAMSAVQQHQASVASGGPESNHVDEESVQNAHNEAYSNNNASSLGAESMGAAAAMHALQTFTSGGGGSGGGGASPLIAMAMQEASSLFDQSGGAASGDKQRCVQSAALTMAKLVMKSQLSGGGSGGGLSSLMGIAKQFV